MKTQQQAIRFLKNVLFSIKKKYPKNKLIKHLMSSLWGSLSYINVFNQTEQQINDNKLDVSIDYEADYTIIKHVISEDREYNCKTIKIHIKITLG